MELGCAREVQDGAKFAGIRAHYIKLAKEYAGAENSFRAEVVSVRDDVFTAIVNVRPEGAPESSGFSTIRIELSKEEAKQYAPGDNVFAAVNPRDVLALKA